MPIPKSAKNIRETHSEVFALPDLDDTETEDDFSFDDESGALPDLEENNSESEYGIIEMPDDVDGFEPLDFGFESDDDDDGEFKFDDFEEDNENLESGDDSESPDENSDEDDDFEFANLDDTDEEESDSPDNDDEETDDNEDDSSKFDIKKIGKSILAFLALCINKLADTLMSLVKILGHIPKIGKFFRMIPKNKKIFKIIAMILPLIIIFALFFMLLKFSGGSTPATIELPDQGKAVMSNYEINEDNNTVTATVENKGEIIADVTPSVKFYSSSWSPLSWFKPQERGVCKSEMVSVDIDSQENVTMKCDEIKGFNFKIEGVLSE